MNKVINIAFSWEGIAHEAKVSVNYHVETDDEVWKTIIDDVVILAILDNTALLVDPTEEMVNHIKYLVIENI